MRGLIGFLCVALFLNVGYFIFLEEPECKALVAQHGGLFICLPISFISLPLLLVGLICCAIKLVMRR